jgi:hypothetical protein
LLIGHSFLGKAYRAIRFAEVTAFHQRIVQAVHQPRDFSPVQLHRRNHLHPDDLKPGDVFRQTGTVLHRRVTEALQPLFDAGLSGPKRILDLPFGGSLAVGVLAGWFSKETIIPFQHPHQGFLPFPILAVAHHVASEGNPVRQNVDVFVFGVRVAGNDILIVGKAHALQIPSGNLAPLAISQMFMSMDG